MEPQTPRGNGGVSSAPVPFVPVDPADDLEAPDLLTPEAARASRVQADRGYWFKLTRTGGRALVRRLSATDRVSIGHLPFHQQQRVLNALARMGENADTRRFDGSVSVPQALRNLANQEEGINAYCVAGFLKPKLIYAERERTAVDEVVVTDLDPIDRRQFFLWCETDNEAAADRAEPFLGQPALDVPHRPLEPPAAAAVVPARAEPSGLDT